MGHQNIAIHSDDMSHSLKELLYGSNKLQSKRAINVWIRAYRQILDKGYIILLNARLREFNDLLDKLPL